jgi:hypothetical protein
MKGGGDMTKDVFEFRDQIVADIETDGHFKVDEEVASDDNLTLYVKYNDEDVDREDYRVNVLRDRLSRYLTTNIDNGWRLSKVAADSDPVLRKNRTDYSTSFEKVN